jgi:hypothetical protein
MELCRCTEPHYPLYIQVELSILAMEEFQGYKQNTILKAELDLQKDY